MIIVPLPCQNILDPPLFKRLKMSSMLYKYNNNTNHTSNTAVMNIPPSS
jgi:hypothetical protein